MDALEQKYEDMRNNRRKINLGFASKGVIFMDIDTAYIDETVEIGQGTTIFPCVTLTGSTKIGKDCVIGQNTIINDSTIADEVNIQQSVIKESEVGEKTNVGPFAYMRPNSKVGSKCKVGDFVEIKNSSMGDGSKASHLTYIGDSDIGKDVNLGCGVVFVNYDGKEKHRSLVKDGAFIGCNVNIISPVVIEESSYVAAGSTVTKNVPSGSLYVNRAKDNIFEGWVEKRGLIKSSKADQERG